MQITVDRVCIGREIDAHGGQPVQP
jgi:hypothetical protein